jgi:hypothetical protein
MEQVAIEDEELLEKGLMKMLKANKKFTLHEWEIVEEIQQLSLGVEPNMERIRVIKKNYLVGLSI